MANVFEWPDYVVFGASLVLSSSTGVIYAVKDMLNKDNTTKNFLLGNRSMGVLPVSASLFVSYLSAIAVLADPVEVYLYGACYLYMVLGFLLAAPIISHLFAIRYHRLNITSLYTFLGTRFHKGLRILVSIVGPLFTCFYMGIALCAPCLAASQLTGIDVQLILLVIGAIGIFYTTLGGIKAVLWADTIQAGIILAGVITVLAMGAAKAGGMGAVFEAASEGKRLNFDKVTPDPRERSSVWVYLLGGFIRLLIPYTSSQMFVQRYFTVSSPFKAASVVYLSILYLSVVMTLLAFVGLVLYALYGQCDPRQLGWITKNDQLVPLLAMSTLGKIPGLSGLFLAALVSASLSTLSSAQHSSGTVFLHDIILPLQMAYSKKGKMTDKKQVLVARLLATAFGILNIAIAIGCHYASSTLFGMAAIVIGVGGAPVAGLFIQGLFMPFVGKIGAACSYVVSAGILTWIGIGQLVTPQPAIYLEVTTDKCPAVNSSFYGNSSSLDDIMVSLNTTNTTTGPVSYGYEEIYRLSPMLFGVFGLILSLLTGAIVGAIEYRYCRPKRNDKSSEKYEPPASPERKVDMGEIPVQKANGSHEIMYPRSVDGVLYIMAPSTLEEKQTSI